MEDDSMSPGIWLDGPPILVPEPGELSLDVRQEAAMAEVVAYDAGYRQGREDGYDAGLDDGTPLPAAAAAPGGGGTP